MKKFFIASLALCLCSGTTIAACAGNGGEIAESHPGSAVPVVPIGKIISNLSVLENYGGMITVAKK